MQIKSHLLVLALVYTIQATAQQPNAQAHPMMIEGAPEPNRSMSSIYVDSIVQGIEQSKAKALEFVKHVQWAGNRPILTDSKYLHWYWDESESIRYHNNYVQGIKQQKALLLSKEPTEFDTEHACPIELGW